MAFCKEKKQKCAIKVISKDVLKNEVPQDVIIELSILKKLNHPCIIDVFDMVQDEDNFYLVQELMDRGNLFQMLELIGKKTGKNYLPETQAQDLARQIFQALVYLESQKIIHRDIKMENILYNLKDKKATSVNVKLADFGSAAQLQFDGEKRNQFIGSYSYMAPEILNQQNYDYKVDVWSATVVLYVLLSGEMPFYGKNTE